MDFICEGCKRVVFSATLEVPIYFEATMGTIVDFIKLPDLLY